MKKQTMPIQSVHRRLLVLQNRVSFLERALRDARQEPSQLSTIARRRDHAEIDARREALKDYYEQKKADQYRENPWLLEACQRLEDDRNAYLRSRGLKAEPTDIPKELRKQARALVKR